MPAKGPCPKCHGEFVELERSGIRIDACRECRGVFLDRGELDQIIEREQKAVSRVYDDDQEFFREMTGPSHGSKHHHDKYGIDMKTAQRLLGDFTSHQSSHKKKKPKSLLGDARLNLVRRSA